ncbi:amino acid deaminase [Pseudomonas sp. NPDC096950]|uniref:amino acid deaminase n=1 Tax=Pseudomonas sp. NPDC096950 TaxID=3364485 RepID=UPI003839F0CC
MSLEHITHQVPLTLDRHMKGIPEELVGLPRAAIADLQLSLLNEDLPLPVAILKSSALARNSQWMSHYLNAAGVSLAPHGKTTLSPELFALQQQDGCWGLTLATFHQVRAARQHGVQRIILANQAVGRQEIRYYLNQLRDDPNFDIYVYVDSVEGVQRLLDIARTAAIGRPLEVLVELGYAGGRTGCRTADEVLAVAEAVTASAGLIKLRGVSGFEGLYQSRVQEDRIALVRTFLQRIATAARVLDERRLFGEGEILLTAGGSSYYDLVIEVFNAVTLSQPTRIVTRSGCYLTHDNGMYQTLHQEWLKRNRQSHRMPGPLEPALEVWGQVLSLPEPELMIVSVGKRDFGTDAGLPLPLRWIRPGSGVLTLPQGCAIHATSDQHAHVKVPADHGIQVGDCIGFGVSHPCTTFDKWQAIYLVTDDYVVEDVVQTMF